MRHRVLPARVCLAVALLAAARSGASPIAAQSELETTICAIQGSGAESPLKGQRVVVEGVVTADFVSAPLDGFFMQAPDCDADPSTSDGLWVYDGNRDQAVVVGQTLRVTGRVDEYFQLSEVLLDTLEVVSDTQRLIAPTALRLPDDPAAVPAYLEAHESMLVTPGPLRIVGATNSYGDAYAVPADSGITRLWRDDSDSKRLGLLFSGSWLRLRHGDVVENAVAPLTYNYEIFKLALGDTAGLDIERNPDLAPAEAAPAAAGELTLASYNVENFFDPLDDPDKDDADSTPSVEQYPIEVARRARSIARNLGSPDLLALEEVEKLAVLEDLAAHPLLADAGYAAALIEGPDGRGIDVGYLYRKDRLRLLSLEQAQACTELQVPEPDIACRQANGSAGWALYSRPPLIARFEAVATGGRITLIANHFKSKRGGDAVTTPVRSRMARHNLELVARERDAAPDVPVIVVGDLNDFEDAEPLRILTEGPDGLFQPWLEGGLVAETDRYSYIFNGVSQILDHMLPTRGLGVAAFGPVHANTDQGADPPELAEPESPRSSDHDPLLMRLELAALPVPAPVFRTFLPLLARGSGRDQGGGGPATATPQPQATGTPLPDPTGPPMPTLPPTQTAAPAATSTPSASGAPPRSPLRIDALFYDGEEPSTEGDEHLDFSNGSNAPVLLTGWTVVSVRGPQTWRFPDGFNMAPGQACRLYTNQLHPEHCGLNWGSSQQAIWRNAGDKAEIRDASGALIDWFCYGDYADQCR